LHWEVILDRVTSR